MATTSLRKVRLILLGAIAITGVGTGSVYLAKHRVAVQQKIAPPVRLPDNVTHTQQGFKMSRSEGGITIFQATAKKAVDYRETGKSHLEDVEIMVYGKAGDR